MILCLTTKKYKGEKQKTETRSEMKEQEAQEGL